MTGRRSAGHPSALGITVCVGVVLLAPAMAWAQEPLKSFDELATRLKVGDTIWVTDALGQETRGTIREMGVSSLTLVDGHPRVFQAGEVRSIEQRTSRPVRRASLWGFAAGALVGAGWGAVVMSEYGGAEVVAATTAACAAVGTVGGAIVGALTPGRTKVVYRAPGAEASAHVMVVPFVTPARKGFAVSVSF